MFLRAASRVVAAVVALSMLIGCAEIDRRGGTVAEIEDYVLFAAHTKSHRLFRSYLLIGVLLAAARQGGHNEADDPSMTQPELYSVIDEHKAVREKFRIFKKEVLENFKMYRVPVIALDRSTSKEAVCVVFEKVNTGGVPLTVFEADARTRAQPQ